MIYQSHYKKAFSLIELLIVISIMAILGSLALSAYSTARKQGRDIQRKGELNQYKVALEQYQVANGSYPLQTSSVNSKGGYGGSIFDRSSPTASPLSSYMGGIVPSGINTAEFGYYYITDSAGVSYKLLAETEVDLCWEVCQNGKSGKLTLACTNYKDSVNCDL